MKQKKVALSIVLLFLLTAIPAVTAFAQGKMTYVEIINHLTSIKLSAKAKQPAMRNYLIDLIRKRGVDKPLTGRLEGDLVQAGATDELIEAIRKYSWPMPGPVAPAGTTRKNSIGMELVWIPPAEFEMGWRQDDDVWSDCKKSNGDCTIDEFPDEMPHSVTIREGFWIGKYEVTQGQWQAVMGDNPSYFKNCGANCPVEQVSWDDIQIFLGKLNEKNDGFEYSLPTEAQWEYAARAGTTADWYGALDDIAWYSYNSGRNPFNAYDILINDHNNYLKRMADNGGQTHPVGTKRPNNFGLYDMSGNVAEWCEDWHGKYSGSAATDPKGPASGDGRVVRGGSWDAPAILARSSMRTGDKPSNRENDVGFRVVARVK